MAFSSFYHLLDNNIITDEDVIIYYNLHFSQTLSNKLEMDLSQYISNDIISFFIRVNELDEEKIKDDLISYYQSTLKPNTELVKPILSKLKEDIISNISENKQVVNNTEKSATTNSTGHENFSIIENNTLVKFDERDLVNGEYTIPENITIIGANAFKRCENLQKVILKNNVTEINACAFALCKNLQSITLPSSVKYIDCASFVGCINLTHLHIPSHVTEIAPLLCLGCKNLTEVELHKNIKKISSDAFTLCEKVKPINLPETFQDDWCKGKFKRSTRGTMPILKDILKF